MRKTSLAVAVLVSVLLVGCVQVDLTQRLYRDQTMDYAVTFTAAKNILEGFKNLPADAAVADKRTVQETDTTLTYQYTKIPIGAKLFGTSGDTDVAFFKTETYTLTKKGGFPYTTYTYTARIGNDFGSESEQAKAMAASIPVKLHVTTFGRITQTNGEKTNDDTVTFAIDPTSVQTYTVSFREWFFTSWFS